MRENTIRNTDGTDKNSECVGKVTEGPIEWETPVFTKLPAVEAGNGELVTGQDSIAYS
jgi:hypothetical protein